MKYVLIKKFYAVIISCFAILYGFWILTHPGVIESYKTYEILHNMFKSQVFGFLFISLGFGKFFGVIYNFKILKIISISGLVSLFTLFGIAFTLSASVNSITYWSFAMAFLSFNVIIEEWLE